MTEQQQQKQRAIDLLENRYRGMENACDGKWEIQYGENDE
jgi:hypothetical protein